MLKMGSKKHKKHKSEHKDRYEDRHFSMERPPSLKLILKVGNNSTPEYGNDSPAYGVQTESGMFLSEYHAKHKKSKKKKKKKDREKRHKHHHKEKRRHRDDSSQEDMSVGDDSSQLQENMLRFASITTTNCVASIPATKPIIPLVSPESISSQDQGSTESMQSPQSLQQNVQNKTPEKGISTLGGVDSSGREPRTCVLKLKQSKSPLAKILDHLLRALEKRDPYQFFAWPVTDVIAPGYSAIITKPMDFLTMRQKIDDNAYNTLQEFADDFRLMCENAIKYNHVETVYHKAAKRLLHVGARMLQPENLMRSLRSLVVYLRELSPKELGFELPHSENQENDQQNVDSADEGTSTGAEELTTAQQEEEDKRKAIRLENDPKSRFESYVDDLTPEEVLAEVETAARNAKNRLTAHQQANKMGFLRQNKDGTTSMKILVDSNDIIGPDRVISLGAFTGKLQQGTGQLQGFREDRRNVAKIVKPLNYGVFSSFAPTFDSRFSNLSKEETELVLSTYGDDTGSQYAESIMEFTQNNNYASTLANGLLDVLTNGEHRKTISKIMESKRYKHEQAELEKCFPDVEEEISKYENFQVNFDNLRSLSDVGIDTNFLDGIEQNHKLIEIQKKLQNQLSTNSSLIEKLHQVQYERLSQPLPAHLSHVARPSSDEIQLAVQITSNLAEMAKNLPPDAITSQPALRKAMGVSNVALEPQFIPRINLSNIQAISRSNGSDIDTTPVPMDLEPETLVHHHHHHSGVENNQVDLESELREFLEGGNAGEVEHDTSSIEQMLLD